MRLPIGTLHCHSMTVLLRKALSEASKGPYRLVLLYVPDVST